MDFQSKGRRRTSVLSQVPGRVRQEKVKVFFFEQVTTSNGGGPPSLATQLLSLADFLRQMLYLAQQSQRLGEEMAGRSVTVGSKQILSRKLE